MELRVAEVYQACYPRSWHHYLGVGPGLDVVLRQMSPVIPHQYDCSCLPVTHFQMRVSNASDSVQNANLRFSFDGEEPQELRAGAIQMQRGAEGVQIALAAEGGDAQSQEGCSVAASVRLEPGETRCVSFSLVIHAPHFRSAVEQRMMRTYAQRKRMEEQRVGGMVVLRARYGYDLDNEEAEN